MSVAAPSRPSHFPSANPTLASRPSFSAASRTMSASSSRSTSALAPMPAVASKDTSSSSGKVFAKPSKEWVLPERAKPGRKVSSDEPDNKRQSQNRLSQRAHRARRTDYIQTLEERLRQYEADEIHSNVRLQEVARALKMDNERLKKENGVLVEGMQRLVMEKKRWDDERSGLVEELRRLQDEVMMGSKANSAAATRGRLWKVSGGDGVSSAHAQGRKPSPPQHALSPALLKSPPPTQRQQPRRPTLDCPICPDPDPDCPCQQQGERELAAPAPAHPSSLIGNSAPLAALTLAAETVEHHASSSSSSSSTTLGISGTSIVKPSISTMLAAAPSPESCGVCQSHDECLCRVVNGDAEASHSHTHSLSHSHNHEHPSSPIMEIVEDRKPVIPASPDPSLAGSEGCGLCTSASFCACKAAAARSERSGTASSDSPVTVTSMMPPPPMPLPTRMAAVPLRFRRSISTMATGSSVTKAPLWKLDGVDDVKPVIPAEKQRDDGAACTGDPANCEACRNDDFGREFCENLFHADGEELEYESAQPSAQSQPPMQSPAEQPQPEHHDTMPPNQAWRALKAHPNSRFASLSLLADVVARRPHHDGPRLELSPLPESRPGSPAAAPRLAGSPGVDRLGKGKKRMLEVETSAVRDALKLLDEAKALEAGAKRQKI